MPDNVDPITEQGIVEGSKHRQAALQERAEKSAREQVVLLEGAAPHARALVSAMADVAAMAAEVKATLALVRQTKAAQEAALDGLIERVEKLEAGLANVAQGAAVASEAGATVKYLAHAAGKVRELVHGLQQAENTSATLVARHVQIIGMLDIEGEAKPKPAPQPVDRRAEFLKRGAK